MNYLKPLILKVSVLLLTTMIISLEGRCQYVQKERDDTIRLMAKSPFDSVQAKNALARGTAVIKGVAFTRRESATIGFGVKDPLGKRIYANKIKVILFPVTPYLLEYIQLKKKENPKKLKYAFMANDVWHYRLEAITNSDGEFTFPDMKPGKYYIQGVLNWSSSAYSDDYTGSGYNGYGTTNYYQRNYYRVGHSDFLDKFIEVTGDNEVLKVKLK